jgi:large subunit ribosomal protein L18Ae
MVAGVHQFEVVGRHKPDDKNPSPKVYRMKLFADNSVVARSRFWYEPYTNKPC